MTDTSAPIVFYDDGCFLCRRENAPYQRIERRGLIRWFDFQQSENKLREHGLSWQTAMQRMDVLDSDGRMVSSADALIALWLHIPRYRLLENVVSLPAVHWCSEQGCSVFARLPYKSPCNDVM